MCIIDRYDGKRFIEVATEKKHDMLLITVDNSFDGILFQENGKDVYKRQFFPSSYQLLMYYFFLKKERK